MRWDGRLWDRYYWSSYLISHLIISLWFDSWWDVNEGEMRRGRVWALWDGRWEIPHVLPLSCLCCYGRCVRDMVRDCMKDMRWSFYNQPPSYNLTSSINHLNHPISSTTTNHQPSSTTNHQPSHNQPSTIISSTTCDRWLKSTHSPLD